MIDTVSEYISAENRKKRRISASNIFNLNRIKSSVKVLKNENI